MFAGAVSFLSEFEKQGAGVLRFVVVAIAMGTIAIKIHLKISDGFDAPTQTL